MAHACTNPDSVAEVTASSDATGRWHTHPDHPLIRSFEPDEDWWWCHADDLFFEVAGAPPAPSHP